MSFEIFWDKLDSDIALSFQDYLNNYFKKIKRPDFLGEVVFSDADFGQIPPEITIIDICDPMPEFYDEQGVNDKSFLSGQDDYNYENEEEKELDDDYYIPSLDERLSTGRQDNWNSNFNRLSFNGFSHSLNNQNFYRTSSLQNLTQKFNALNLSEITSNKKFNDDSEIENSESSKSTRNNTIEKSKSFYSDISFDFDNLTSYLLKNTIGESDSQDNENSDNEKSIFNNNNSKSNKNNNNNDNQSNKSNSNIIDKSITSSSHHTSNILNNENDEIASTVNADDGSITSEPHTHEDLNSTIPSSSHHNSTSPSKQRPLNLDIQVELEVIYKGNLKLTVSTELILNKPTPAFMTLPIKLALKGISFKGIAIIAYIGKQIDFCFKEPEESESLIEDIRLESELGDGNKQVLKNISKIEGFLTNKIKSAIDELLIFPNYHSIYISKDE